MLRDAPVLEEKKVLMGNVDLRVAEVPEVLRDALALLEKEGVREDPARMEPKDTMEKEVKLVLKDLEE